MGRPVSKPHNFQALARTWDDPDAFAQELAIYYAQLAAERAGVTVDITQPRRSTDGEG